MFCRRCKYDLRGTDGPRCPECGQGFDPTDARSYRLTLEPWWRRRVKHLRHVWLLPLIWTACSWLNFHHPGDEYAGWACGSVAGIWVLFIIGNVGDTGGLLFPVLAAGALVIAIFGWIMDKMRIAVPATIAALLVMAATICTAELLSYPSLARAISKNGSLLAYVLPAVNLGLCIAALLIPCVIGLYRLVRGRLRRWAVPGTADAEGRARDRHPDAGRP